MRVARPRKAAWVRSGDDAPHAMGEMAVMRSWRSRLGAHRMQDIGRCQWWRHIQRFRCAVWRQAPSSPRWFCKERGSKMLGPAPDQDSEPCEDRIWSRASIRGSRAHNPPFAKFRDRRQPHSSFHEPRLQQQKSTSMRQDPCWSRPRRLDGTSLH